MNKTRTSILHSVPSKSAAVRRIRKRKIVDIRRKLTKGRYDVNERLNAALERILEDLAAS